MSITLEAPARPPAAGPPLRRLRAALGELWGARELTTNLVWRDLKVRHRGTFLGMLWSLTTPLLIVALYYFIFRFIFRGALVQEPPRPDGRAVSFVVYFFCGLTIWNLFATAVASSTSSVTGAAYLLGKVYFPRAILPLTTVLSALVTFGFELAVLLVVSVVAVGLPDVHLLWLPVIVAVAVTLAFGLALILSTITVFLRDMAHFVGLFVQLWFWGTPVLYSLGYVADREGLVRILEINPMTGVVVSFRNVILLNRPPELGLLAYDAAVAVVLVVVGTTMFARWQRVFPEIV